MSIKGTKTKLNWSNSDEIIVSVNFHLFFRGVRREVQRQNDTKIESIEFRKTSPLG